MSKLPPELHPLGGGDNRPEPRDPQFVPDPECRESLAEATHELQLILDPDFLQSGARYPTFFIGKSGSDHGAHRRPSDKTCCVRFWGDWSQVCREARRLPTSKRVLGLVAFADRTNSEKHFTNLAHELENI